MEVSGHLQNPSTQLTGGWEDPGTGLDAVDERQICCPCHESTRTPQVSSPHRLTVQRCPLQSGNFWLNRTASLPTVETGIFHDHNRWSLSQLQSYYREAGGRLLTKSGISLLHRVQTAFRPPHTASYPATGLKQLGREADHSPAYTAEINNA
jgi:hypothetical protein